MARKHGELLRWHLSTRPGHEEHIVAWMANFRSGPREWDARYLDLVCSQAQDTRLQQAPQQARAVLVSTGEHSCPAQQAP